MKLNNDKDLKILYEDGAVIVCVKPAGIACETKNLRQQDMVSLLRNYRVSKGEEAYAGLVHRLDQPVEGILVFGKDAKSTAALCGQLREGNFSKIYLAATLGAMPVQEGQLVDYLKKDGRSNTSSVTNAKDPRAKKAVLSYRVLQTDTRQEPVQNLVKIYLLTGRHHQIRVQMANMGTPIAGDLKYGSRQDLAAVENMGSLEDKAVRKDNRNSVLKLCACELGFFHPDTKKEMHFQIEPSWNVLSVR